MGKVAVVICIVLCIAFAMITVSGLCIGSFDAGYKFNSKVHGYFENAYYASDPVTMRENIVKARDGMKTLELTDDMYGAWLPWDKTPDRKMMWQYQHIDSVLIRIDEFQKWESSQSNTGSQQMQDVYTQKLDNVRHFIKDDGGWSDWIARDAFVIRDYFVSVIMFRLVGFVGLILSAIGLGISLALLNK